MRGPLAGAGYASHGCLPGGVKASGCAGRPSREGARAWVAAAAGLWAAARGSRLGTDGLGPRWVAGWEEKRGWAASGFPGFNWVVQGGPSAGFGLGFGPGWVWG